MLADCGLGKTPIFLEYVRHVNAVLPKGRAILMVCPLMVVRQTIAEAKRFYGDELPIVVRHSQGDRWDLLVIYPMGKGFADFYSAERAAKREAAGKRHPLQRIGEPDEIAALIAFLLSDASRSLSGQILRPDGGLSSLRIFS